MSSVINTNVMSLNAQRNMLKSSGDLATSMQRLSTGLRINSAKDDAAGLAISERMTSQIRGLNQAARNANDGISLAQTAEGALVEVTNNLQRIRELAVQSRNATNSNSDRAALDAEAQQLRQEVNRIAGQTQFNGVNLLDGSFSNKAFQIGANAGQTITISSVVNANDTDLGTYTSAQVTGAAATGFANAIADNTLTIQGGTGAAVNVGAIAAAASATERAGQIRDAINAVADQTGVYARNDTATTVTLVSTSGNITIGGTAATADTGLTAATTNAASQTGFAALDLNTTAGADTAITQMDAALEAVNSARAELGAIQTRFESAVASVQTTSENLSAARSRIRDADFAAETANLTRAQILQQAGVAMLSQANAAPQNVLSLLRG